MYSGDAIQISEGDFTVKKLYYSHYKCFAALINKEKSNHRRDVKNKGETFQTRWYKRELLGRIVCLKH